MSDMRYDAVVIGSGPGGYACGIRLGQLGMKVAVVEKTAVGGVCLNVGCIPSKALIHAAKTFAKMSEASEIGIELSATPTMDMGKLQAWKRGVVNKLTGGVKQLVKANQCDLVEGAATIERVKDGGYAVIVGNDRLLTPNVVVATGSRPIEIPGFAIDQKRVLDSTGALDLESVPGRMVVIGGGYIGLELGQVYAKLGCRVTVIEAQDSVLTGIERDCARVVVRKLNKMGVEVMTQAKAKSWTEKQDRAVVIVESKDAKEVAIDCDAILVTVGRRPNSNGLGLEALGVQMERGFVVVDQQQRTNMSGIYAIGDVAGGLMLAHKATKEAEVAAEVIAGHSAAMDTRCIPVVVFTDPEIASTGLTEAEALAAGHELQIGKFPFAALGRALSVRDTEGFAKVVADAKTQEVLGIHIVGNGASDLISEGALAIEMGAVLQDIGLTVHPHPTLSEAVVEAAKVALGEAIHLVNR